MDYKITTNYDIATGDITQTVESPSWENIRGTIIRNVIHTKEAQVREALIALGWTPPKE